MKIDHRRSPLVLLLVAATIVSSKAAVADTRLPKQQIGEPLPLGEPGDPAAVGTRPARVGTEHAPVDGKDGMPHEGPWVETAAERSRRKDSNKDDVVEVEAPNADTAGLPQSNEGVMDDKNRKKPEDGTRGVEGGVPDDLPAKPHDIPHPENPSSPNKDATIDREPGSSSSSSKNPSSASTAQSDHEPAVISPIHSLVLSFAMILVSEIGDKTFLVACLMAMRHDRLLVFSAAFSALIGMTVLSAVLGHAVPSLIPKQYTNFLASCLFLVFGIRMLLEARKIAPDEGVTEEMNEAHQPRTFPSSPPQSPSSSRSPSPSEGSPFSLSRFTAVSVVLDGLANLFSFLLSPAWVQTFVMTFLGEWGDRSQVATIAMAAGQDYCWVTAGALAGHAICTGVAVLGGKAIAGRVSLRTVTLGGAIAFLAFAILYLLEALY
ncbi:hypothetical protein DV735_g362, partial [Chaetothyriales sp. CBS 134920]